MPKYFRDCVIAKSCHDLLSSDNYRPISLASCLISKVLERIVLNQYSSIISHPLQFGFKSGSSIYISLHRNCEVYCFEVSPQWLYCARLLS